RWSRMPQQDRCSVTRSGACSGELLWKVRPWMAEVELMAGRPTHCATPQRNSEQGCEHKNTKQWSRPVSRVLCALRRDSHSSRPVVTGGLKRPTRERRGLRHRSPIWSCFGWGLPCRSVARLAVGSYPTVSPLPDPLAGPSAVYSLLHFPSARAAQALPGTLPFEARTFLGALANDATVRPTPRVILSATVQILARRAADHGGKLRRLRGRKLPAQQRIHAAAFGKPGIGFFATPGDHQHAFAQALLRIFRDPRGNIVQRHAAAGFVQLGQFAQQPCFTLRAENVAQIRTTFDDAMRGFVDHQRARFVHEFA